MTQFSAHKAADYLLGQGFAVRSIHDPSLWNHLEQMIRDSSCLGGKFAPATTMRLAEMMTAAEDAALSAMAEQHQRAGKLDMVEPVVAMPFIIGTEAFVPLGSVADHDCLSVVVHPGESKEHVMAIVPVADDAVPSTKHMTVRCGVYADGRTLGVRAVCSGGQSKRRFGGQGAYLATPRDLHAIVTAMSERMDDITSVTRQEGEAMLSRLQAILE